MDDGINVVFVKECICSGVVRQVDFLKGKVHLREPASSDNRLHAGVDKVICNNDIIARLDQLNAGMRTDIAGAACY